MNKVIKEGKEGIPVKAQQALQGIWVLFLISWFLYPGAYLMPHLAGIEGGLFNESGVVGRQMTYTVADVCSKVIYGVMLTYVAQILSKEEGYEPNKNLAWQKAKAFSMYGLML